MNHHALFTTGLYLTPVVGVIWGIWLTVKPKDKPPGDNDRYHS